MQKPNGVCSLEPATRVTEGNISMSNELIISNQAALQHLATVAAQAQGGMRLLKFIKGKWYVADDEVSADRTFIAHAHQLAHGWVKFNKDHKVEEQRIGIVAEGYPLAKREDLGDTDTTAWEIEDGQRKDPWVRQLYLPMEDSETGELLTFVTGSQGGNSAIGKLTNHFVRNVRNGLPLIQLEAGSYKHKKYGPTPVPEFRVTGWTGGPGVRDAGDDIPF
jgi:hypothetical protein